MFEAAELGITVDKKKFEAQAPKLREALLAAQRRLADSRKSCVILVSGVEGAGKRESVSLLLEWMDARGILAHAAAEPTDEERARPEYYRFWRRLPPKGRMGIFMGSWYTRPIIGRTFGELGEGDFDRELDRIAAFEKMLVNESTILVKLWMHVSKKVQKHRLEGLERHKSTAWRVTPRDWKFFKKYDRFRETSEHAIRKTSTAEAPWTLIEAEDERHRSLAVAQTVLDALNAGLQEKPATKVRALRPTKAGTASLLGALDVDAAVPRKKYEEKLPKLLGRVSKAARKLDDRSLVLVFEGPDAAGKGGTIRRVTQALEPGQYDVTAFAAPTEEERAHPYLWRFWRSLPRIGKIGIFDRSWYGRVLVERVEGFAAPAEWQRAYEEINEFEEQLVDGGAILRKFWLAISAEEQLRRFKDRQTTPYKQYKITEDDWRNRAKWDAYEAAANEMFERTSTEIAPWQLVPANDKHNARLTVLETIADALDDA